MNFTGPELDEEYRIAKTTRLGILCEDRTPTMEQEQMAHIEAKALVTKLKLTNQGIQQLIDFGEAL